MNKCRCDIGNVDVHKASDVKHLRSKKHLENELIIPELLFEEPIENNIKKTYNPKPFRQIAKDNIKLDDKDLAKKMINP